MCNRNRVVKVVLTVLGFLTCTASVLAGGGNVLPPSATPKGYSLSDIAVATAVYNTWFQAGFPAPAVNVPNVPFEVLIGDTTVKPGTMLYLPIFVVDDSGGAPAGFPADIIDQDADADFLDGLVAAFGVDAFIVQVDGQTTVLNDDYITGTTTAPLRDGTPAGTHYIVSAAFLSPLAPGNHTVGIGGIIGGEPVVFVSTNVTVR
jgi:hypothetical protein